MNENIENFTPPSGDWRRQGQEKYLYGVELLLNIYYPHRLEWDHDHCEFCGAKFSVSNGNLKKGYSTTDHYHWICCDCYNDFKGEFMWQLVVENENLK